jgi:hypothetical protein
MPGTGSAGRPGEDATSTAPEPATTSGKPANHEDHELRLEYLVAVSDLDERWLELRSRFQLVRQSIPSDNAGFRGDGVILSRLSERKPMA